ncbi:MAG: hypothetical protein C6H99_01570 [Epsilonproteobacteria bacterium]|nr:hypothetical protein [Campylobacterota bacterium]NPA63924.1 YceI family protein [Campylobacterota bacterium]
MRKIVIVTLLSLLALAQCQLHSLRWTAFKTPLKAGVKGTFDKIAFLPGKACLDGAEVIINKHSVNTGNKDRDKTLDEAFFSKLKGDIKAKIVHVDKKRMDVQITLNGQTKTIPFTYEKEEGSIEAHGVIDIFDFSGSKALQSINKACYDLHQGKTWNDVELSFTIDTKKHSKSHTIIDHVKSMM